MTNGNLTKEEFSNLLHSLDIAVNEGISSTENESTYPRAVYWIIQENDVMASGEGYKNQVTYQVSLFCRSPQHEKYKELRKKLRELGLHPVFYHEYVENDKIFAKTWHTYLSLDVLEDIKNEPDGIL